MEPNLNVFKSSITAAQQKPMEDLGSITNSEGVMNGLIMNPSISQLKRKYYLLLLLLL